MAGPINLAIDKAAAGEDNHGLGGPGGMTD